MDDQIWSALILALSKIAIAAINVSCRRRKR